MTGRGRLFDPYFWTGLVTVLLLAAGVYAWRSVQTPLPPPLAVRLTDTTLASADTLGAYHDRGDTTARPVVVEFTDYQCPACRRENRRLGALLQTVSQKDAIHYRSYDRPLRVHGNAVTAAVVVHCATMEDPRAYWPVRNAVFRTQEHWATSISALERISAIASRAGDVEASTLRSCLEDRGEEISRKILQTAEAARKAGVMATPTLLVDGEAVTSEELEETLREILDGRHVDE